jgi:hypothetical protein
MRASGMFTYLAASRYAPAVVALGYMVTLAVPTLIAATDVTHSTRFPYIIIMYYKHTLASFTTVFIWKFSYGSLYRNASFSG